MNRQEKRQRVKDVLRAQRAQERDAFPLPPEKLGELFEWLNVKLEQTPCDHSRRLTQLWLGLNGLSVDQVLNWLDSVGGYCDCEIVGNAQQHVEDAMTDR